MSGVHFYAAKVHGTLNRRPLVPEAVTGAVMLNPVYAPSARAPWGVLPGTRIISDSTAFQTNRQRLTPQAALERQLRLRDQIGLPFEAFIHYDMVLGVDEALDADGRQVKRRGTVDTAAPAVAETLRSAEVYASAAAGLGCAVGYAAQGASSAQYAACVAALLQHVRPGVDWLCLGGFCILGRQKSLLEQFRTTLRLVLPLARAAGVARVHLLGVCWHEALAVFAEECARVGLVCSTDSSAIEVNSVHGRVWHEEHMRRGGSPWRAVFPKASKFHEYHPADLTGDNLGRFTVWARAGARLPRPQQQDLEGVAGLEALAGAA